ncbi:phosphatase PAP2 family protein [Sphingomonas sp. KR1UV-12]|uniref:Phosphatase PAP2 family protein n=1 Tax=Sphingomonas aurea TaxID=3063994 RepID=A0ABT9EN85_9SPHN|nr:phosphatase PAP2 family protein [Sphingomonas sp. KR1UV-12]MDP1028258.1 phosphatase PAP2 family protein [Sphingomonas sp. KR1UV-12]
MGKAKVLVRRAAEQDRQATHRAARRRDGALVRLSGKASEVADQPPLIALSTATILMGAVLRRPAVARAGVRMLASHLIATAAKTVLKTSIDRTRPARALREGHRVGKGTGGDDPSLNSFPSGHTAGAVAVAQAVATEDPLAGLPLQAAAVAIAALQPSRGKHYLSDVIAGAAIGWAAERLARPLVRTGETWLRRFISAEG